MFVTTQITSKENLFLNKKKLTVFRFDHHMKLPFQF